MTEEVQVAPPKPADHLTVTVNKQPKEVFMSGGLIRVLLPYFRDFEDFAEIFSRPEEQIQIIVEALRDRSQAGRALNKDLTIFDFEMTQEDSNKLVQWIVEHCLHFFIDSVTRTKDLFVQNKEKILGLTKLMQSLTGTVDLPGMKLPAGDLTQSQAS